MRNMRVNRQSIHIAHAIKDKVDDYGNKMYDLPFVFHESVSSVDKGDAGLVEYGEKSEATYKSVVNRTRWEGLISEGDAAYLEGAKPDGEVVNGSQSNFTVGPVLYPTLNTMVIYFERK